VPTFPSEYAWLQPLLDGLMAKQPENRFASGEAFIAAVEQLLAASPEAASIQQEVGGRRKAGGARLSGGTTRMVSVAQGAGPKVVYAAGAALALLLVFVGAWLFWGRVALPPAPAGGDPRPVLPADADLPPVVHVPSPVDAGDRDLELMLTQADTYTEYGTTSKEDPGRRLVSPPEENAVDLYRQVLERDPQNPRAQAGLQAIRDFYLKRADDSCERALWTFCKTLAEDGLRADQDSAELKALLLRAEQGLIGG
jgi:hypothetical protein